MRLCPRRCLLFSRYLNQYWIAYLSRSNIVWVFLYCKLQEVILGSDTISKRSQWDGGGRNARPRVKIAPQYCHHPWHSLAFWVTLTHTTLSIAWTLPYPRCVLLHLVLVAMGTSGMSSPEAVLTELVIVTLLASVAKPHHTLTVAVGTLNRMED